MSSIEDLISKIDSEYWKIRQLIEASLKQAEAAGLSEKEAVTLFENIVKFQNFLESKEIETKSFSGVTYYKRCSDRFSSILDLVRSDQTVRTLLGSSFQSYSARADTFEHWNEKTGHWADEIEGLVYEAEELVKRSTAGAKTAEKRSLSGMLGNLRDIELQLIKLYGDFRLMSGLQIFSIEEKTRVTDGLIKLGFKEAVGFLDEAESNLRLDPPHLKDSLANCRNALESVIYSLAERQNVKVQKRWTLDLNAISETNPSIVDDATKSMIQGVFSYLSVKGSHIFGKVDKSNLEEVEFGFEQTYRVLAHILAKINV